MRPQVALENPLGDQVAVQSSIELWSEKCICAPASLPWWRSVLPLQEDRHAVNLAQT